MWDGWLLQYIWIDMLISWYYRDGWCESQQFIDGLLQFFIDIIKHKWFLSGQILLMFIQKQI
jgi:hypothetical protein